MNFSWNIQFHKVYATYYINLGRQHASLLLEISIETMTNLYSRILNIREFTIRVQVF